MNKMNEIKSVYEKDENNAETYAPIMKIKEEDNPGFTNSKNSAETCIPIKKIKKENDPDRTSTDYENSYIPVLKIKEEFDADNVITDNEISNSNVIDSNFESENRDNSDYLSNLKNDYEKVKKGLLEKGENTAEMYVPLLTIKEECDSDGNLQSDGIHSNYENDDLMQHSGNVVRKKIDGVSCNESLNADTFDDVDFEIDSEEKRKDDQIDPSIIADAQSQKFISNKRWYITCHLCGLFVLSTKFEGHLKYHQTKAGQNMLKPENLADCPGCKRRFRKAYIGQHKCVISKPTGETEKKKKDAREMISCQICGHVVRRWSMSKHMKNHSDAKPFECEICKKGFNTKGKLAKHTGQVHGERTFQCEHCPKVFRTKSYLNDHVKTHSDIKSHICLICGQGFSRKQSLTEHCQLHTDLPKFTCPHCGKKFHRNNKMQGHIKTVHDDVREWICSWPGCFKQFKYSVHLRRHMYLHIGKRPLKCELCDEEFAQRPELKKHLVKKHKTDKMLPPPAPKDPNPFSGLPHAIISDPFGREGEEGRNLKTFFFPSLNDHPFREFVIDFKNGPGANHFSPSADFKNMDTASYLQFMEASSSYLQNMEASSTYLQNEDTSSTYLQNEDTSSTYLQNEDTSSTYLQNEDTSSTYLQNEDTSSTYLQNEDTSSTYLQNEDTSSSYLSNTGMEASSSDVEYKDTSSSYNQGVGTSSLDLQCKDTSSSDVEYKDTSSSYIQGVETSSLDLQCKDTSSSDVEYKDTSSSYIQGVETSSIDLQFKDTSSSDVEDKDT